MASDTKSTLQQTQVHAAEAVRSRTAQNWPTSRKAPRPTWAVEIVLALAILIFVVPVLWMLVLAVQPLRNIISSELTISFSLDNLAFLFQPHQPFTAELINSVVLVMCTVIACVVVSTLAGYVFAHLRIPRWVSGSIIGFAIFLALTPPMTLVPGIFAVMTSFHLTGGIFGLVLLNVAYHLTFSIILMTAFFRRVPHELREAAITDGASEAQIFVRIMVPIVKSGMAAVAVYVGLLVWNEFVFALTMTPGGTSAPVTVGIAGLINPDRVTWGRLAAGGAFGAIPMIILAWTAHKPLVAGLTSGGAVKG